MYLINGLKTTKKKLLNWLKKPETIVTSLAVEFDNLNKDSLTPLTMEGFDIQKDYLIMLANKSISLDAEVKVTLENCRKLGGKTVILIVK